ncbi:hypothetical protein ACB288_01010 [Aeromonas taiwanensis]
MVSHFNLNKRQLATLRQQYIKAFLTVYGYFVKDAAIEIFDCADLTVMKDIKAINSNAEFMQFDKSDRSWGPLNRDVSTSDFSRAFRVLSAVQRGVVPELTSL